MKLNITIEGEDEILFRMLVLQAKVSPEQLAKQMISDGLRFVRETVEAMAKGATMNEATAEVLQRRQLEGEPSS